MKKIYTLCIAAFIICSYSLKSNASTVIVNVEDNEFNPDDFTINLGDTVMWMWDNSAGAHTTTSTIIPTGAASWDQPINQGAQMFIYIPAIAGSYDYICSFHVSMGMVGHFTVLGTSGIAPDPSITLMSLNVINPATRELQVIYSIPVITAISIRLYDIIGNEVNTFVSSSQNAGINTHTFAIPNLAKGIYFIRLETQDAKLSQKLLIL